MRDSSTKSQSSWLMMPLFFAIFSSDFVESRVSARSGVVRRKLDDIAGSIDIDCGLATDATYTDPTTEIPYISDDIYITTGANSAISPIYISDDLPVYLRTVRSFPEGNRNCYSMSPPEGRDKIYLIRATFMYGNYDNKERLPEFDVYVGVNRWGDSVKFENASHVVNKEIIHVPPLDHIYICLVNTGFGTPFISALEVRHFHNSTYSSMNGSLVLYERLDFGSTTGDIVRYNDDAYDRIWYPYNCAGCTTINTTLTIDSVNRTDFNLPSKVMKTASRPADENEPLSFALNTGEATLDFAIYMHFAELEALAEGEESRVFDISLNGAILRRNVAPSYLHSTTVSSPQSVRGSKLSFSLSKSMNSTHPPVLNALEVFVVSPFWQRPTDQGDVDAIEDIKSAYGVQRGWQGDPCAPIHPWDGLNCSNNGYRPYRIISLNLSSSGLTGQIPVSLSNLQMLEHLDLSNNSISGEVPPFLSQLPNLRTLNLGGNKLSGPVPSSLTEKSNNGSLTLSLDGNPKLCIQSPCKEDKNNVLVPVIATIVTLLIIFLGLLIYWKYKRSNKGKRDGRSQGELGPGMMKLESREFTYPEIVRITDNFRTVVGKGGFGVVYHGHLDDAAATEVAVKLLSPSATTQGSNQFQTEAQLLTRVHHKNLASFVGYCNDGTNVAILYEYMGGGDLEKHLSDRSKRVLSWKERLQIALDAAQGLEYLHVGCKPPIVHRDVKTSNILLTDKMQAKIADFGLSKLFPVDSQSHLSTKVVGTVGYLDPEYYTSNRLTEKSDVYSFGIVLLQLITGRPAITVGHNDNTHIANWARPLIAKGDLRNLVDPRLHETFDTNSAWKLLEVSISCVRSISIQRPTMNHVVAELKECLEAEIANEESSRVNEDSKVEDGDNDSFVLSSSTKGLEPEQGPQAR